MTPLRTAFAVLLVASLTGCLFDPTYCWESDKTKCCADKKLTNDETDVDCGGSFCGGCADGKLCAAAKDCGSGVCTGGKCAAPTCTDGVKNGTESDKDCGGTTCGKCADGKACAAGSDCTSRSCAANVCAAPTCTDQVQNGSETDADCGGSSCGPCADGSACADDNANCGAESYCDPDSVCQPRLSCSGIVACAQTCTSQACASACNDAGTQSGQSKASDLITCIYTNCLSACQGGGTACQTCTQTTCAAQTAACQVLVSRGPWRGTDFRGIGGRGAAMPRSAFVGPA